MHVGRSYLPLTASSPSCLTPHHYEIGRLQDIRAEIQEKQKVRSSIFDQQTIIDDYVYHWGGRAEPQFNVARRMYGEEPKIRYGMVISFQDSQRTAQ